MTPSTGISLDSWPPHSEWNTPSMCPTTYAAWTRASWLTSSRSRNTPKTRGHNVCSFSSFVFIVGSPSRDLLRACFSIGIRLGEWCRVLKTATGTAGVFPEGVLFGPHPAEDGQKKPRLTGAVAACRSFELLLDRCHTTTDKASCFCAVSYGPAIILAAI